MQTNQVFQSDTNIIHVTIVKGWGGWKQEGGEEWCPAEFNPRNQITAPKKEVSKYITWEANRQKEKKNS